MSVTTASCLHCLQPLVATDDAPFCCLGCRAVYALLHEEKLERFYALRGPRGRSLAGLEPERRDRKWLDGLAQRLRAQGDLAQIVLDVQGLHCAGCVWLIQEVFRRQGGGRAIVVNPALGRLHVTASPAFELARFVEDIERFGYLLGPPLKGAERPSNDLVWRLGVCVAIAMNSMIFAIAIYAGLAEGALFQLFQRINLVLSFVSVAVGGSVFITAAHRALRRGILHLDLPIALGILLSFAGSVYSYAARRGDPTFVDTLNVFIALMLLGRWLQQRVLERNRLALLASDGVDGLLTRRVARDTVETVPCSSVSEGDTLLLAPGDLLPVDATARVSATFSLDWINGESRPRAFAPGERIPAGAFHAGVSALEVTAARGFSGSGLIDLLRTPAPREADPAAKASFWHRFTRIYVLGVLFAAGLGFALWAWRSGDIVRAAEVATAVLVVTCPCAFGLATPLAYDLVSAGLRRAGLFVRAQGFLDRAARVRAVVFDKTGTVTMGALAVANPEALEALPNEARAILYALVARSHHPKSVAIRRALERIGRPPYRSELEVLEHAGLGLEALDGGRLYRLGAPRWAAISPAEGGDVVFAVDGISLSDIRTVEPWRRDAQAEIHHLRDEGYDVYLLSGDAQARVDAMASACGIPADHAIGDRSPAEKAAWVIARDHDDLLMVGDGINDSLAVEAAYCSGTPAVDRPFMAARSDFYFVATGLAPIRQALRASRALADVRARNLCIALAYNTVAIALAYAGLMSPLVCAVIMPASSLSTVAATVMSLNARSRLWRS